MRRRNLIGKSDKFVWVRLDDCAKMIKNWTSYSTSYYTLDTSLPIYALAAKDGIHGSSTMVYMYFTTNPSKTYQHISDSWSYSRIILRGNYYTSDDNKDNKHVRYCDENGTETVTFDFYKNMGWISGQTIDVYNRESVSNIWIYYSSDASQCHPLDTLKGTVIYFFQRQTDAALTAFYALVNEKDIPK